MKHTWGQKFHFLKIWSSTCSTKNEIISEVYIFTSHAGSFSDRCDDGWIYFRLNCYLPVEESTAIRWMNAENSCVSKGSHLVSVRDPQDSEFLFATLLRIKPVKWARMYIGTVIRISDYVFTSNRNKGQQNLKPDTCEPYNIQVYITYLFDLCNIKHVLATNVWF